MKQIKCYGPGNCRDCNIKLKMLSHLEDMKNALTSRVHAGEKILTRWYHMSQKIATVMPAYSLLCWKNCGQLACYAHCWWQCDSIKKFGPPYLHQINHESRGPLDTGSTLSRILSRECSIVAQQRVNYHFISCCKTSNCY